MIQKWVTGRVVWVPLAAAFRRQGNLNSQIVSSVGNGATFVTNTITSFRNDEARWLISLPTRGDQESMPTLYNQEARKSSTVEPDDARYRLVTNYLRQHNVFGLVDKTTQQWTNAAGTTQTRIVSEATYDAKGRYSVVVKNALGLAQTLDYYPGTGVQKSLLDASGQLTAATADSFGRVRMVLQAMEMKHALTRRLARAIALPARYLRRSAKCSMGPPASACRR